MDDVLGYAGSKVVVTGAASGMGEATAKLLVELGAEVTALDIQPSTTPGVTSLEVDLRDRSAIDDAVRAIGPGVQGLFNSAGLPGPPFSPVDVMLVNFVGARHLISQVAETMGSGAAAAWVASAGGLGWQNNLDNLGALIDSPGFDEGKAWCEAHPEQIEGGMAYPISKQAINAYVAKHSGWYWERGVRINCSNPGPTSTAMMPFFEEANGVELIKAALGPMDRYSTPEEQAWPLVFLNSPRLTYVTGEAFFVDGGFFGALQTGMIDFSHLFPTE